MSNNQIDDFEPLGVMLDRVNDARMAARRPQPRPDNAEDYLKQMNENRDQQIAQLSQTDHGRKVLAGHGITVTAHKVPTPHLNPNRNRGAEDGGSVSAEAEDWLAEEGRMDADLAPGGKYGPQVEAMRDQPEATDDNVKDEPEMFRGRLQVIEHGTPRDQAKGEAMAAQAMRAYNQMLAEGKIPQVGPDGVAIQSVTYHNMNIKTPGSYNSTIHGLSQEVGEYGPAMKIDLFLDGTTSFREALHTIAHEVCHGDPALSSGASGAGAHGDPAIEAVCNAYANKVVKAYFGE